MLSQPFNRHFPRRSLGLIPGITVPILPSSKSSPTENGRKETQRGTQGERRPLASLVSEGRLSVRGSPKDEFELGAGREEHSGQRENQCAKHIQSSKEMKMQLRSAGSLLRALDLMPRSFSAGSLGTSKGCICDHDTLESHSGPGKRGRRCSEFKVRHNGSSPWCRRMWGTRGRDTYVGEMMSRRQLGMSPRAQGTAGPRAVVMGE